MALSEKVKRWMTITFLVLLVIGFVVPGFLNLDETAPQNIAEPRLCQSDSECYLTCEDIPLTVLCLHNICQQNACDEPKYYAYQEVPITFSFSVEVNGKNLSLKNRGNEKDIFVKFQESSLQVFSRVLTVQEILEKGKISYDGACVLIDGENYCADSSHGLKLEVNGKELLSFPQSYVPKEGDAVVLKYELKK